MHGWACGRAAVRILLLLPARTARLLIGGDQQEERQSAQVVRSVKFRQTSQVLKVSAGPDVISLQTSQNTALALLQGSLGFLRSQDTSADVAAAFKRESRTPKFPEIHHRGHRCEDGCLQARPDPPRRELLEPGEPLLWLVRRGPERDRRAGGEERRTGPERCSGR